MNKINKYILLVAVLIISFSFYWFELRPAGIKKNCFKEGINIAGNLIGFDLDEYYKNCLRRNGL